MVNGRIAVLIPAVYDPLDKEFLMGVQDAARLAGLDTLVFTSVSSDSADSYMRGENNIYELPFEADIDGIILAANRISNVELKSRLVEKTQSSTLPCVAIEEEYDKIKGVFLDEGSSMRDITEHLISVHGCTDIICLTGPEGNREAEERAEGYALAMNEHGLNVEIVYGDFWRSSPAALADKIFDGEIRRPQAVVCANDVMAVALCQQLQAHGLRVPEDIRITGYDGSLYTLLTSPAITTTCGGDRCLGMLAVRELCDQIGIDIDIDCGTPAIRTSGSCGCGSEAADKEILLNYAGKTLRKQLDRKSFMFSNYIAKMSDCESIPKFAAVLDNLRYMLSDCKTVNVCLCDDWRVEYPDCRKSGFSKTMQLIYSENQPGEISFPLKTLLPQLNLPHEPQFWVFGSLHYFDRITGYIATSYDSAEQFAVDEHYIGWCDAVANGLDIVIKKSNTEYIWQKLEAKEMTDIRTGLMSRKGFVSKLKAGDSAALISFPKKYGEIRYFVPIVSAVLRSEGSDRTATYFGTTVFGVILRGESAEDIAQYICRSLSAFGIYIAENELQVICTEIDGAPDEKLNGMYEMLTEKAARKGGETYFGIFSDLRKEMRYSPQSEWSISSAAAKIGLSGSHFQRLYRKYFGRAFNEELIGFRIDRAKYMLCNTELSIQQIAVECGYNGAAHFMRQFAKCMGMSAGQYRKEQRNE